MFDDARRRRTVPATVAIVVLVVSAGCVGILGGDGGAPTPTDPGGDGGQTATGTLAEGELPPGVESGGVDVTTLADAHDETLSGSSFTTRLSFDQTRTQGEESLQQQAVQTNRLGPDGTYHSQFEQSGNTRIVQSTWGNDSVAVTNVSYQGTSQFRSRDPAVVRRNLTGRQFVVQFVRMGDYAVDSSGAGQVTLSASGPAENPGIGPNRSLESYDGTLVVGANGRIQRMEVDLVVESQSGVRTELSVVFEVVDVGGTTVEKPDWVDEALQQVSGGAALSP